MRKVMLLTPLALLACAAGEKQRVPIESVWMGTKCVQSAALDSFKGEPASTDLAARIMMASRANKLRWVPYGAVITMEYSKNRVTVRLDQTNHVISAACG